MKLVNPRDRQLYVVCCLCDRAIAGDGQGVLMAPAYGADNELDQHWVTYRNAELKYDYEAIENNDFVVDWEKMNELHDMKPSKKMEWKGYCFSCMEARSISAGGYYDIPVDDLRTWAGYMDWSRHLHEKTWLKNTDWDEVMWAIPSGKGPVRLVA